MNLEDKPLIILGGGREVTKPKWEFYETDDSIVQDNVTGALKEFLPAVFPGKFRKDTEPEMVWVRMGLISMIMSFYSVLSITPPVSFLPVHNYFPTLQTP